MRDRLRRVLPAVVSLTLFLAALEILRRELHAVSWHALVADVRATPSRDLIAALLLTGANYAILTGYDLLAFRMLGRRASRWRIAVTSFLGYAVANNVGFAVVSGTAVRYRFYSRWGVSAEELPRIVFFYSTGFWLGLLTLGGLSLALGPPPTTFTTSPVVRWVGWSLALASLAYVGATARHLAVLRLGTFVLPLPPFRFALAQLAISLADWALAATVLFVLLPPGVPFVAMLGAFVAAQLIGLVSHVPGGAGVFEGLMVLLLKPYLMSAQVLPALLVYRVVYYLVPFVAALVGLVIDEARRRREALRRVRGTVGRVSQQLTPTLLAMLTFLSGVVLLFSGATPAAAGRLAFLHRFVPLAVIETSHIVGSVAGAALLLLSQGLGRRLDAAWYMASATAVAGVVASLLKGADVEEAALLTLLLVLLRSSHGAFDRRAAFFETRFSPGWTAAVVAALAASVWLGLFAYKHVEYSTELWWQFQRNGEASRFLRGSVAAASLVFLFGLARLLGPAPHEAQPPADADLVEARAILDGQPFTAGNLVFLRDKAVMFDPSRRGFLMYGVQARTWVALGDPIGPPDIAPDLIRQFLERSADYAGTPVFYEVGRDYLHHYADFGMTFVKLGEEAIVDLRRFTLQGGRASGLRHAFNRLEKEGASFRVAPREEVPVLLPRLRAISDDWLAAKGAPEKGFSLGFFDPDYLAHGPVAVVERNGALVAFANVWTAAPGGELSIDLMRYHQDAPRGVMEGLFVHLMAWGREQGYTRFSLGMAPMSGFETSPVAPLWARVGHFLYEHGDALYSFQGLRAFKEKFDPEWASRYLAYSGALHLPRVLADVSALIAGGYRRIFLK